MTKVQLLTSMERIMPNSTENGAIASIRLPMAAVFVASHAFVHDLEGDFFNDCENVRKYLLSLETTGSYKFE